MEVALGGLDKLGQMVEGLGACRIRGDGLGCTGRRSAGGSGYVGGRGDLSGAGPVFGDRVGNDDGKGAEASVGFFILSVAPEAAASGPLRTLAD